MNSTWFCYDLNMLITLSTLADEAMITKYKGNYVIKYLKKVKLTFLYWVVDIDGSIIM